MSTTRLVLTLVIAATMAAGCSAAAGSSAAPAATAGSAAGSPAAGAATVAAATAPGFGTILTGPDGRTLYTYSADSAGTSTCTGGCASAWPPLTVPAGQQPTAGNGVTGTLSTLARADGTTQVADDGRPLYYWQGDAKPGDVTGDGVNGFAVAKAAGGGTAPAPSDAAPATSAAPSSSGGRYGY